MQLGSDNQIRDGLLAENTLLSEKPRLGFERTETTVHQASIRLNYLNGNRVSSTVCWNVRQVSLMAQQQNGQQGIDNSLKYKTVTGGQKQGPWEINWSLKHNSKKGGFIVQHIVADFGDAGHFDYYEAWPVAPGTHTPSIQGVDGNGNLYSDMFSGPAGSHIHGSARFYEGLNLPDSFTVHPPGFPAGILRSTTTNPNLPTDNATAPNVRWWGIP